jgi:hypothetical protein
MTDHHPSSEQHVWVGPRGPIRYVHCERCLIIKPIGKEPRPCKGAAAITLRKAYSDPKGGPEYDAP